MHACRQADRQTYIHTYMHSVCYRLKPDSHCCWKKDAGFTDTSRNSRLEMGIGIDATRLRTKQYVFFFLIEPATIMVFRHKPVKTCEQNRKYGDRSNTKRGICQVS